MAVELRDQFALEAMKALSTKLGDPDAIAKAAYKIADAMLRARVADLPNIPSFDGPVMRKHSGSRRSLKPKATRAQVPQIIQLKKEGLSNKQIADRLGVNGQSINGLVAISRGKIGGLIRKSQS